MADIPRMLSEVAPENPMAGISIALLVVGGLASLLAITAIVSPEKHMKVAHATGSTRPHAHIALM